MNEKEIKFQNKFMKDNEDLFESLGLERYTS